MAPSGRSAIPTESPSSIQNPIPSSVVRSRSDTTTSAPRPAGTVTHVEADANSRRPPPGGEGSVVRPSELPAGGSPGPPRPGGGEGRGGGVAGQIRVGGRDDRARRERVDGGVHLVDV